MRRAVKGFTLIELAVAVAILAIGAVAAYRSFDSAQRGIGGQLDRAFATEVALNRAAMVRLLGGTAAQDLPPRETMGSIVWDVDQQVANTSAGLMEVTIVVSADGRPGARYVVAVPRQAR